MTTSRKIQFALIICAMVTGGHGFAETASNPRVSIELNSLEPVEGACRVSFLVENSHASDIDKAVYEAVVFDTDGRVDRLTLFDFGALPSARPRVRQFLVPDLSCDTVDRLLINGAETCTGGKIPEAACTKELDLRSRTDVEILG